MLHITNGDCAVAVLSRAVSGTFLPWRDVLHEGPVRAGLSLEQLSAERARFMSIQSAVQHLASALGAFLSARMLRELPDGSLDNLPRVALVSIGLTALVPPMMYIVERRVLSAPAARFPTR